MDRAGTRRSILRLAGSAGAFGLFAGQASPQSNELVRESAYNYIIVSREGARVFFRRMENGAKVSAIDLGDPGYQIIPYTRYLFSPALINPARARVLSIGLGAGSFNRLFNLCYPEATLATVEIDRMIVDLAVEFTNFRETADNTVIINDGRRYLHRSNDKWDWIVIDAFVKNSQYPPHMATHEFFALVSDHLTDNGVMAINIIEGNKLFSCLVATIKIVFPNCVLFDVPESENAVVLASKRAAPSLERQISAASAPPLPPMRLSLMKDNGVDLVQMRNGGVAPNGAGCARPLTDDFSPTEFLGAEWRR